MERSADDESHIFNSQFPLYRFIYAPMDICRNAAKIDGFYGRNEAFTWRAVFFGFPPTAPKQFHSMRGAAFRTDTFDCKTIGMIVSNSVNVIMLIP